MKKCLALLLIASVAVSAGFLHAGSNLVPLWSGESPVAATSELPILAGTEFSVIKPYEVEKDGYRFLHGVALAWHKGRLYASFGHNKGNENTETEEARYCVSDDGGRTWSDVQTMDAKPGQGMGVSHGVFLSHEGKLWAFQGAYSGRMGKVHTRAYVLDEAKSLWIEQGVVVADGFWPMQEPLRMEDGNWVMSGIRVGDGHPAAVAISHGNDLTRWDLVVLPRSPSIAKMWGESTVIVDGRRILNFSRYDREMPVVLYSESHDFGRTWRDLSPSNLPMAASKPYTGTLSTGHRYLIGSSSSDGGNRRHPLTIAIGDPGKPGFSRVFVIRHALFPEGPGESNPGASLAYPYAIEHAGKLYVGYSNNGGNQGRKGEGRELWNNNSAEMAIILVRSLTQPDR